MICKECGEEKIYCKELCVKCYDKMSYQKHREKNIIRARDWYHNNKLKARERGKRWAENNRDKVNKANTKWREKNIDYWKKGYVKENACISAKKWRENNLERDRENKRIYQRKKEHSDINYKLRMTISTRIKNAILIQSGSKAHGTIKLLGCSIQECIKHLESQFTEKMTMDNHGYYGWHMHHKVPCKSFDLTKESEQLKCFHYTNLQPMWWDKHLNLKRGKTKNE